MTSNEILQGLSNFTGTTSYYRYSPLFPNMVLTDGTKYLAEAADAYWLMDAIASYLPKYREQGFAVVKLSKFDHGWKLRIEDGNNGVLASQVIEFSDFPLDTFTLYVAPQGMDNETVWVIMLTSEY